MRMPDKHAFLSPSSSERWFNCTPSAWLCEQFPDLGSVFAAEGTEAHRLCEFLLHEMLGIPDVDPRPGFQYYTEEMEECCRGYARFIREKIEAWKAKGVSPEVFIEQRVDLRTYMPAIRTRNATGPGSRNGTAGRSAQARRSKSTRSFRRSGGMN